MKHIIQFIKNIVGLVVLIVMLFVVDMVFLSISYVANKKDYEFGYRIPGLDEYNNPNGITYSKRYGVALQTSYNSKEAYASIYVLNTTNGKVIKELRIKNNDNTLYSKRATGIATDENIVWITSDYEISEFLLDDIMNTEEESIASYSREQISINKADFCFYSEGVLWIGEFYAKHFEELNHIEPLLMGFDMANKNYAVPSIVITLPSMVRDMVYVNGTFIITRSLNSFINSNLSFYKIPIGHESEYYTIEGVNVPLYHFDKDTIEKKLPLPPLAKGLYYNEGYVNILTGNASREYFYAFPKVDTFIRYYLDLDPDDE